MIIKRLLTDSGRLFSKMDNIDTLINTTLPATAEIIKTIDFLKKDGGKNSNHWLRMAKGFVVDNITRDTGARTTFIGALGDRDRASLLGGDSARIFDEFGNSYAFLTETKTWLLNSKGQKYSPYISNLNSFNVSNEDYEKYFKYITLCLNGTIEPDDWDTDWMWNDELDRLVISNPQIIFNKTDGNKIQSILEDCVASIVPYVNYK